MVFKNFDKNFTFDYGYSNTQITIYAGAVPTKFFSQSALVRPPPSWIVHEETVPVDEQLVSINEGEANEEHSTNESSLEESNLKPAIPNPHAKQNQKLKSALRTLGPLMLSLLRSASSNAHEYLEDRVLPAQIPSQKQVRLEMQKRYHGQYLPWYRYHKKLAPSLADATVTRDK